MKPEDADGRSTSTSGVGETNAGTDRWDEKGLIRGGAVACFGAALVLLGYDIIPQRVFEPNVPGWLLIVLGFGLILAGVSPFFRIGSPRATRLAGASFLLMALVFVWIAVFGDPRHMSGGIPFLPRAYNVLLGRLMFSLGGLLWLSLGISALRHARHQPVEGVIEREPPSTRSDHEHYE